MIVDDDDDIRELLTEMLEDSGYRAVSARDGAAALELLRNERPR